MSITFGGLGSGLDTSAIIDALLAVEAKPIALLEQQKATNDSKLSLIGTLEGLVSDLQKAASKLTSLGGFYAYSVSTSDESAAVFSVTGSTAALGAHTLEVLALAAADRYTFDPATPITDPDADLGAGNMHFTYGGTVYDVAIASGDGLNAIASKINAAAGDAVTATVINVSTSTTPDYQLVIAGNQAGADFAIGELDQSSVPGLGGLTQLTVASNAQALVDGLLVERSDNVFDGVVAGLSFTAQAVTTAPVTFAVAIDDAGVKENVQELITAYNAVMTFIHEQSQYDSEEKKAGPLFGDSVLSTVKNAISSAVLNVPLATVQSDTEGYSTLGLVGIDVGLDGTLTMDEAQFGAKLAANPDALANLFAADGTGLMEALDAGIAAIVDSTTDSLGNEVPGVFERRKDTLESLNKDLEQQIEDLEYRVEQMELTLIAKFSALEELMAGLNAQGQYLASALLQY